MAIETSSFSNGYVVNVKSDKGVYTVQDVKRRTPDGEKDCMGIEIPTKPMDFEEITKFLNSISRLRVFKNTPEYILDLILSNKNPFEVTLHDNSTFDVRTGSVFICTTEKVEKGFNVRVRLNDEISIEETFSPKKFYALLAGVIKSWSQNQLRVNSKVR